LICILPSFTGEVSQALKNKDTERAQEIIAFYKETYGSENVYLEITHHPEIPNHQELMR
jgi:DNA polymerase III alpha subunit